MGLVKEQTPLKMRKVKGFFGNTLRLFKKNESVQSVQEKPPEVPPEVSEKKVLTLFERLENTRFTKEEKRCKNTSQSSDDSGLGEELIHAELENHRVSVEKDCIQKDPECILEPEPIQKIDHDVLDCVQKVSQLKLNEKTVILSGESNGYDHVFNVPKVGNDNSKTSEDDEAILLSIKDLFIEKKKSVQKVTLSRGPVRGNYLNHAYQPYPVAGSSNQINHVNINTYSGGKVIQNIPEVLSNTPRSNDRDWIDVFDVINDDLNIQKTVESNYDEYSPVYENNVTNTFEDTSDYGLEYQSNGNHNEYDLNVSNFNNETCEYYIVPETPIIKPVLTEIVNTNNGFQNNENWLSDANVENWRDDLNVQEYSHMQNDSFDPNRNTSEVYDIYQTNDSNTDLIVAVKLLEDIGVPIECIQRLAALNNDNLEMPSKNTCDSDIISVEDTQNIDLTKLTSNSNYAYQSHMDTPPSSVPEENIFSPPICEKKKDITLPEFKRMQQKLDKELSVECCHVIRDSCQELFQKHLKVLDESLISVIHESIAMFPLTYAHGFLQTILLSLNEISNPRGTKKPVNVDAWYCCFYLLCLRILNQDNTFFIRKGLELIAVSAKFCNDRPLLTRFLVECVRQQHSKTGDKADLIFKEVDERGENLLMSLIYGGDDNADVLYEIVRKDGTPLFDVQHVNKEGYMALHIACKLHRANKPCLRIVHILLKHAGAELKALEKKSNETAVHFAVNTPHCDLSLVLLLFFFEQRDDNKDGRKKLARLKPVSEKSYSPLEYAKDNEKRNRNYPREIVQFMKKLR